MWSVKEVLTLYDSYHGSDILEIRNWWRRRLWQNEKQEWMNLMLQLSNVTLIDGVQNMPIWMINIKEYISHSFVQRCNHHNLLPVDSFSICWKTKAPPEVKFFSWFILNGRIPSKSFLHPRAIISTNELSCAFCASCEMQDHLLLHCKVASSK